MKVEATSQVEVLQPGLFSSIQDLGRTGFLEFGVPLSGPMDPFASGMANLLLQNSPNAAVLEMTQLGPKLKFSSATQIVITGAHLSPELNGIGIENNKTHDILPGDILAFKKRKFGCRAYLAVKNGFKTEQVLESRSWYEGVTTFYKLEKGMKLAYQSFTWQNSESTAVVKEDDYLTSEKVEAYAGPEFYLLPEEKKKDLQKCHFSIGKNNNRMGIQLQELFSNELQPILTGPVLPGTLQLTPSGTLIVLMMDGQTTGGYPRVLQLGKKGIATLAQKVQGDQIQFILKDLQSA